MYGGSRKRTPTTPPSAPPQDALAALMEGKAPDKKSLLFPDERDNDWQSGYGSGRYSGNGSRSSQHYGGDHGFDSNARPSDGEYGGQQQGALDTVKSGAVRSGTYVKDKSVAGAQYLKERDWSKEKVLAGKAGAATKSGAVFVGSNVAKGAGWLYKSSKSGVDNLMGKPK